MTLICPICGTECFGNTRVSAWTDLAGHIDQHADPDSSNIEFVQCFCGQTFRASPHAPSAVRSMFDKFTDHLRGVHGKEIETLSALGRLG